MNGGGRRPEPGRSRGTSGRSICARDGRARRHPRAVAAFVIWGLLTIYWKALEGFNAFELIAYRITCSAVVLALLLSIGRQWGPLRAAAASPKLCLRIALAGVLITVNWTSYVWAVVHDHVIETALGYFMGPLGYILIGVVCSASTCAWPSGWRSGSPSSPSSSSPGATAASRSSPC